jgi:hypothetical protein
MVLVPKGKSYDEAEFPGRRALLVTPGGAIMQLSDDRQGFGAMRIYPGPVAGPNISAGVWQNVTAFNELVLPGEYCTLDPATGKFSFGTEGIWRISLFFSIRHNNAGAYREMNARLHNITKNTDFPPFQIPSGSAATITNFAFSAVYKIPAEILNDELILQIQGGAGSNYTNVSYETMNLSLSLEGVS